MYKKPAIISSFDEDSILGGDRVAFADVLDSTVPGWTHHGNWNNRPPWGIA
jgi:hypothetical protein